MNLYGILEEIVLNESITVSECKDFAKRGIMILFYLLCLGVVEKK